LEKITNSLSFYFLFPAYLALVLLFTYFNVPKDYYSSLFIFYTLISLPVLFLTFFSPLEMRLSVYYQAILAKRRYRFISLAVSLFILACSPLDIYVNGFKWLAPETYADIKGLGREVRHITIMCWILIPVAYMSLRSALWKFFFISYALLFPVLIIDRNRFFISCYALFLCAFLNSLYQVKQKKKSQRNSLLIYLIPVCCLLIFALLGHYRSGNAFIVPTSGEYLAFGSFPLKESFSHLSALTQQIILYITTPIFNLATIISLDFANQEFLLSQFSPFSRENFAAYPYAPILVPRFNVGTEFYPFLLYGGITWLGFAFIGLLISFIIAFYLLKKCPNIFTFLIFIRISYNALFMGFAPQFYILLNLMFIILMILLWFFAELIRVSTLYPDI
jgi:hypothetical protein